MNAIIALCLVLAGCAAPTEMSREGAKEVGRSLRYFQDERTGQCFATVENIDTGQITNSFTVTWVPCDAKVLEATKQ